MTQSTNIISCTSIINLLLQTWMITSKCIMNKQENTKKTPIFGIYQMNGDVVVICHPVVATIALVWHCLSIYQGNEHPQHICRAQDHTFTASYPN